jgi:hypothetical protein
MAKPITGTKDLKQQVTVLKATGNNISKIRCPRCKQLAHPQPDGKGGQIAVCTPCNIKFAVQSM